MKLSITLCTPMETPDASFVSMAEKFLKLAVLNGLSEELVSRIRSELKMDEVGEKEDDDENEMENKPDEFSAKSVRDAVMDK